MKCSFFGHMVLFWHFLWDGCSFLIFDTPCKCIANCRTGNADCCPDYFSHCEGLYGEKYEAQLSPLPATFQRHSEDNYYEQVGPSPETILGPPADCPHGVLDISGKTNSHLSTCHYSHD